MTSNVSISPSVADKLRAEAVSVFVPITATGLIWLEALCDNESKADEREVEG